MTDATDLYRFFDTHGRLLYIGISLSFVQRMTQHKDTKPWWDAVAGVTVERFPTRTDAARAEQMAIEDEAPLHNVKHNHHKPPKQSQVMDLMTGDLVGIGCAGVPTSPFGRIIDITGDPQVELIYVQQRNHETGEFNGGVIDIPTARIGDIYYVGDAGHSVEGALEFCAKWAAVRTAERIQARAALRAQTKARLCLVPA